MQTGEHIRQDEARHRGREPSTSRGNARLFLAAGILLGLGLGGFVTVEYPAVTVANLELNTLMDGFFHY